MTGFATIEQAQVDRQPTGGPRAQFSPEGIAAAVAKIREPLHIVADTSAACVGVALGDPPVLDDRQEIVGMLPPLYPEWLGSQSFCTTHGTRFPYVAGEMANGIATTRMVIEMARAEMLGFFGAAGLDLARVDRAVNELVDEVGGGSNWGVNLIHSPGEPQFEERVADLLVRRGVPRISASAFMGLTLAVVRCAATGLRADHSGRIERRTQLFAKVSRLEVAERFMSPAPAELLDVLVARGQLTQDEAKLAARVPVAEDVTVEADSGGHTDNRPLMTVLPAIVSLRDQLARRYRYARPIRVGAAGGLGSPDSVAAAFALGAAYVVTGSVNQASVEAGLSDDAKGMLAKADLADVGMAPAADMFELGIRLQVLRRGTLFASRAAQLYEIYRNHPSLERIPAEIRSKLERDILRAPMAEIWAETAGFWQRRDPAELAKAERDPKHRMALLFRWYLGKSSRWAIDGELSRRTDYQIWCGPAMGAFNRWTAGSFLAEPANRSVVQIARNLLEGAAVITRAHQLRTYGVPMPAAAFAFTPRPLA
ncbi:PfaD family polyunsaturated fatty acid/polyketide biosynthesis protein [Kibdelosporangium philippinense]|uniref:PfaD family polyunsaturated fatty acid/polyketide biosynthesis protein n=1 Tax=Kibdelosporangium philippinense TaxID=211113 RepID=A0ABS8Z503_9PSEU|nr:PfaD family polyunsaturated fatty acid/polyketide biosynthesis protein [Kibdelosporangium philippinense]MCE7002113.1 PfaD family polyunsaturated fatty acid/polyketide biosynthesis protein [Kibdelosporangium philippinense]